LSEAVVAGDGELVYPERVDEGSRHGLGSPAAD
jgi:hypothetical protein